MTLTCRGTVGRPTSSNGRKVCPPIPNFFHLSVWLQNPMNASRFQGAGINLFTGLWKGPTDDQMAALTMADMPVICDQTTAYLNNPTIKSWLLPDGPDNAQELTPGSGNFGPCDRAERGRGQVCTDGCGRSFRGLST